MPQTIVNLSADIDRALKYYMADYDIKNKRIAIIQILEERLRK